jgi:hypothetical protein
MEKSIAVLDSFEEADRLDREYYQGLTPNERVEILLELNQRWPVRTDAATEQRLARVYRITELS